MSAEWKVRLSTGGSLAVWDGDNWRWGHAGTICVDQPPPDLRPLVLIDPEDEEQVERLRRLLLVCVSAQAALREYASPTPPRPDEPMGLGAVVVDADGIKWVRSDVDGPVPWWNGDDWRGYADISAVEVLSAGVES